MLWVTYNICFGKSNPMTENVSEQLRDKITNQCKGIRHHRKNP